MNSCSTSILVQETEKDAYSINNAVFVSIKNVGIGTLSFTTASSNSLYEVEEGQTIEIYKAIQPFTGTINLKFDTGGKAQFIINSL